MEVQYKKFQNNSIPGPYLPSSTSKNYSTCLARSSGSLSKLEESAKNYTTMPIFSSGNYSAKSVSYSDSVYSSKQESPVDYDPEPKEGPKYEPAQ